MRSLLSSLVILFSGCAISTQHFHDITYHSNGAVDRELRVVSRTIAPPFAKARSIGSHSLEMLEEPDGWIIEMGSTNDLTGGDSSKVIKEVAKIPLTGAGL